MKRVLSVIISLLVSVAYAAGSGGVSVSDTTTLQEVEVTAIKGGGAAAEAINASSVIGRKDVERLNIVSVKGMSDLVPNFFVPDYGSRITSSIYVRGLGARMDQPAVGLIVDNVPILNKDAYDFDVADITKIEMLRGPQSTLYGRNTMCGLITLTTLSPLRYEGLRAVAEYGSGNSALVSASAYKHLTDDFGMALTVGYTGTDGFYRNEYSAAKVGRERQWNGRLKTDWSPSSTLMLQNTFSLSNLNQSGYPYEYVPTGQIAYNDTCFYRRLLLTDGLTVKWRVGKVNLSSITSVQYISDNMTLDQDFRPEPYFTLTQRKHETGVTQDFVASMAPVANWNWTAGIFGFYKHLRMDAPVTFLATGIEELIENHRNESNPDFPIKWDSHAFVLGSRFVIPTYGLAAYTQHHVRISDFTITAGLRLDYEASTLDYHSDCSTSYTILTASTNTPIRTVPIDIDDRGKLRKDFLELLPKIAVSYTFEAGDVYASVAKGYKAGGFNTQMFSDVLQQRLMAIMGIGNSYDVDEIVGYKPEKSWNYEAGTHLSLFNKRLKADLSVFYIDCRDQQLTMFPDGTTTGRIMTNAGKTRSCGFEVSLETTPWRTLHLRATYGFTDARFRSFFNGKEDFAGCRIPYAPANTLFLQADYTWIFPSGALRSLSVDAHMSGAGRIYWNETNSISQPFYCQLGASVTAQITDHISLQLWGENLTDTQFYTFYFMSMSREFRQKGRPLRIGATLRINI